MFGVIYQLALVFGILIANIFGLPLLLGTEKLWPYLMAISYLPAIILYAAAPFMVETPNFIFSNDTKIEATLLSK